MWSSIQMSLGQQNSLLKWLQVVAAARWLVPVEVTIIELGDTGHENGHQAEEKAKQSLFASGKPEVWELGLYCW